MTVAGRQPPATDVQEPKTHASGGQHYQYLTPSLPSCFPDTGGTAEG